NGTALCVVAAAAVGSSAAPGRFGAVGLVLGGIEPSVAVVLRPSVADDVRRGARLAHDFGPAAAPDAGSDSVAAARLPALAAGSALAAVALEPADGRYDPAADLGGSGPAAACARVAALSVVVIPVRLCLAFASAAVSGPA